MTLREMIEVMEAFERGAEVEHTPVGTQVWQPNDIPRWDWHKFDYRVKPKPKQTVVIEKWLCHSQHGGFLPLEGDKDYFLTVSYAQVKLLDTYEVTL